MPQLDTKIPLSLIITILLQTLAVGWWAASIHTRLDYVENNIAAKADLGSRLIRVEEQLQNLRGEIANLRRALEHQPGE